MTATGALLQETRAARIELEISIDAPVERVWKAVTAETDSWWVSGLRCLPGCEEVVLEARAGGQMTERRSDGGGLLWFTVISIDPPHSLVLVGHVTPPFGGPSTGFLELSLEANGGATVLKVRNSMHGVVDEGSLESIESGWSHLFTDGLKAWVERGQRA